MPIETYPSSVIPSFTYDYNEEFGTITFDYEGERSISQQTRRFPARVFTLSYPMVTKSEWVTLHNFYIRHSGGKKRFWFFDFEKRNWVDLYVGRGGPIVVDGAVSASTGGTVFADQTREAQNDTINDMTLLPSSPQTNDAYYFGGNNKFDRLTVTISTNGAGTWTITWEYWNGSAWTSLSGVTDGTGHFRAGTGDRVVTFTMPSNWVDNEVKTINLYWIRARVSAFTSMTTQPRGAKATLNTLTYDLPSKSTTNDSSFILYVNGVSTSKTFVSGGGGGGADRVTLGSYAPQGALITTDLEGYLRIKAVMPDKMVSKMISANIYELEPVIIQGVLP